MLKYVDLQANIKKRVQWCKLVDTLVSKKFDQWGACSNSLRKTFNVKSNDIQKSVDMDVVNSGTYGKVIKTTLKANPTYPVAIKKSFNQEIDEARRAVLVSALVESEYNPHFVILIDHFHCEAKKSRPISVRIGYAEGYKQIQKLQERIAEINQQSTSNRSNNAKIKQLQKEIDNIIVQSVPTIDEIKWTRNLKNQYMQKIQVFEDSPSLTTSTPIDTTTTLQVLTREQKDIYETATRVLDDMLARRKKLSESEPYELFVMEYVDENMLDWVQTNKGSITTKQLYSCAFQVCAGIVSLLSYFGMVQNDLHIKNIMYNAVPSNATYIYDMGKDSEGRTFYYNVPLHGRLFKIIDFGLSTNIQHTPYCDNLKTKNCTAWNRDMIEFFDNLVRLKMFPKNFREWAAYVLSKLKTSPVNSVKELVTIINIVFSDHIAQRYSLGPSFIHVTKPPTSKGQVTFQLQASEKRRKVVVENALKKKWFESSE
mgnify:CR=1 FL=1